MMTMFAPVISPKASNSESMHTYVYNTVARAVNTDKVYTYACS